MTVSVKPPLASKNKASPPKLKLNNSQERGQSGENQACAWLIQHGYRIVERNFRTRAGEIDIIAWDGEERELVFVEVKYRQRGEPAEAITPWKRIKLIRTLQYFIIQKHFQGTYRLDTLCIDPLQIRHLKSISIS